MIDLTLKQTVSIEFSYSFQWGNAFREAILRPWKLPLLPVALWKGHLRIQRYRSNSSSLTPFLFVIDYQKFTPNDRIDFQTFFNSLQECEVVVIGDEHVDEAAHRFPSIRSSGKEKRQWNDDLERLLTVIVESSRPEKFVFVGQYPYAGIMGLVRTLQPKKDMAWLPLRAKPETLSERANAFGHVLNWPEPAKSFGALRKDCVYISERLEDDVTALVETTLEKVGLDAGSKSNSKVHFLHQSDEVEDGLEEKGVIVVSVLETEKSSSLLKIQYPANHVIFSREDSVYFNHQVEILLQNIANGRFPGPKKSMIEEKSWVSVYSSF